MTTARVTLPLYNLSCGGEPLAIERAIAALPGVTQVYVNPLTEMAYVVYDSARLGPEHLRVGIEHLGYGAPQRAARQVSTEEIPNMIDQSAQPPLRRSTWVIPLLIVVVLAGAAIWIWNFGTTSSRTNTTLAAAMPAGATQTNEGGQVTIAATWQGSGTQTVFKVAMNTHAVDLDGYDLKRLAVLRIDGAREIQPNSWEAPKGGHHRSGTLIFPATDAEGRPLIASHTRTIQLVIRDVAGVPERIFTWQP